jgi:hypothetical protein
MSSININEIVEGGGFKPLEPGKYTARLSGVDGVMSKGTPPNPQVVATFEILDGESEGEEHRVYYVLSEPRVGKDGKKRSRGITGVKAALAAVGEPMPGNFDFPYGDLESAQKVAKLYGKKLGGKNVTIVVEHEPNISGGKPWVNTKIVGVASGASIDDLAGIA